MKTEGNWLAETEPSQWETYPELDLELPHMKRSEFRQLVEAIQRDALEEAAAICDGSDLGAFPILRRRLAEEIRALKPWRKP